MQTSLCGIDIFLPVEDTYIHTYIHTPIYIYGPYGGTRQLDRLLVARKQNNKSVFFFKKEEDKNVVRYQRVPFHYNEDIYWHSHKEE